MSNRLPFPPTPHGSSSGHNHNHPSPKSYQYQQQQPQISQAHQTSHSGTSNSHLNGTSASVGGSDPMTQSYRHKGLASPTTNQPYSMAYGPPSPQVHTNHDMDRRESHVGSSSSVGLVLGGGGGGSTGMSMLGKDVRMGSPPRITSPGGAGGRAGVGGGASAGSSGQVLVGFGSSGIGHGTHGYFSSAIGGGTSGGWDGDVAFGAQDYTAHCPGQHRSVGCSSSGATSPSHHHPTTHYRSTSPPAHPPPPSSGIVRLAGNTSHLVQNHISPSISSPSGRCTPNLTYSKTSGSGTPSTHAGPSAAGSPMLVSPAGSTPRDRVRGKSVGMTATMANRDAQREMVIFGAGDLEGPEEGGVRAGERERMRTRTITGKSTSSRGGHPMGSMMDMEVEMELVPVRGSELGGGGAVHRNTGESNGSNTVSGHSRRKLSSASYTSSTGRAPLSTSSSSSTASKKHHDSARDSNKEQDRDHDLTHTPTNRQHRSGTVSVTSALTDSNSIEANANADNSRAVGPASPSVGLREKPKGVVTRSAAKGKGRDYGDRFIPQRDPGDLASSYRLMPEHVAYSTGAGSGGIFGGDSVYLAGVHKVSAGGSLRRGMGDERDDMRDDANRAYAQILQTELYGSSPSIDRPRQAHTTSAPSQSARPSHSGLAPITVVQGQYAAPSSVLPPLPAHAPTAPASSASSIFATTARGGSGSTMGAGASRMYQPGFDPSGAPTAAPPSTPSRKRMFNFQSPQSSGRSSPGSSTAAAVVSPGGFGLGQGLGTGVGIGLDDMMNEKYSMSPIGRESQRLLMSPRKSVRFISKTPFKVLDAPDLADDFYLNLVSWSNSNILGVGLSTCVYLWSAHTSKVTKLCDLSSGETRPSAEPADTVTGLEWTNRGSTLAIGTGKGIVEIWDTERCKKIRTMTGHTGRVGALAWNDHILSTGSRDHSILHRDVRAPSQYIRELKGHRQEVCGLRWNPLTDQLASGGNDNKLFIWDKTNDVPLYKFSEHCAAVKAITWSPHQRGLLASGGGTADKKIRFWNALTGTMLSEWDTGSQVCNLMWSKNSNELVSTHGYSGGAISNQICVWRYPNMSQVATLSGHTFRVLYLAMSPDGQTIVTGAGDETLRFWNAFQKRRTGEAEAIGMSDGVVGHVEVKDESVLNPFARIR